MPSARSRLPMLTALLPFVAGIALAPYLSLPAAAVLGALLPCGVLAWRLRGRRTGEAYLLATLALAGALTAQLHAPRATIPRYEALVAEMRIDRSPLLRGRSYTTECTAGRYRLASDTLWRRGGERLLLRFDSSIRLQAGMHLYAEIFVEPLGSESSGYARLMAARGFTGRAYLARNAPRTEAAFARPGAGERLRRLHEGAVERLLRLPLGEREQALCLAMVAGERSLLDTSMRERYARAGTAHLLAVSGLHVGIVFTLLNLLLWPLGALRYGHVARNGAVIAAVWCYAAATGLPVSALRAAIMCSALQFALAASASYRGLNILAAAAFALLAVRPGYLYDVSFQLSFTAVAAIIAWGVPLHARMRCRWRAVNALLAMTAAGAAATLATAPLASYWFGRVGLLGAVAGPLAILLAHGVVMLGCLWLLLPLDALQAPVAFLLGTAARWLDRTSDAVASVAWGAPELRLPLWAVLLFYAAAAALTALVRRRKREKSVHLPHADD